jgi:uncharacterized damage-inducible protein DinB
MTQELVTQLLDIWDRNNAIMLNLLKLLPAGALSVRALPHSPTIGQQLMHLYYIRLAHVEEATPRYAVPVPEEEWPYEDNAERLAGLFAESASVVRGALAAHLESGEPTDLHYDSPLIMLMHLIWHEAYHHGQIKLTLKLAGMALPDEPTGIMTWGVWMDKGAKY